MTEEGGQQPVSRRKFLRTMATGGIAALLASKGLGVRPAEAQGGTVDQDEEDKNRQIVDMVVPTAATRDEVNLAVIAKIREIRAAAPASTEPQAAFKIRVQKRNVPVPTAANEKESISAAKQLKWDGETNGSFGVTTKSISDTVHITPNPNSKIEVDVYKLIRRSSMGDNGDIDIDVLRGKIVDKPLDLPVEQKLWVTVTAVDFVVAVIKDNYPVESATRSFTRDNSVRMPMVVTPA